MWQDHDRSTIYAAGHHGMFDSKVSSALPSYPSMLECQRTDVCTPRWLRHLNLGMNPMESLDGLGNAFPRHGSAPIANDSNDSWEAKAETLMKMS